MGVKKAKSAAHYSKAELKGQPIKIEPEFKKGFKPLQPRREAIYS